jgi:hypothetical protein
MTTHPSKKQRDTRLAAAPLLLAAGLLLAACGSGSPSAPAVAQAPSAPAGSGAASASPSPSPASGFDQALAFSKCMRAHGLPKYPDPTKDGGKVEMHVGKDTGVDPNSPQYKAAETACRSLEPQIGTAPGGAKLDPTKVAAWAACIRTHGLPNFPDPQNSGGALTVVLTGTGISPDSSQFQKALAACQSKSPGGGLLVQAGPGPSGGNS